MSPDGTSSKALKLFNGVYPGPVITASKSQHSIAGVVIRLILRYFELRFQKSHFLRRPSGTLKSKSRPASDNEIKVREGKKSSDEKSGFNSNLEVLSEFLQLHMITQGLGYMLTLV